MCGGVIVNDRIYDDVYSQKYKIGPRYFIKVLINYHHLIIHTFQYNWEYESIDVSGIKKDIYVGHCYNKYIFKH